MAKHGRYKIVKKVADGGMAEIFLATQMGREGFQKTVVLKRVHSTIYADPQFRNMFLDEAHISMSLSHSNIVQILDLGLAGGRYFLVLELVDGWDLGRILLRANLAGIPLPRELGLYMTAEICRALSYAHGKTQDDKPLGIVHRDVSPHNVLVSEQGEVKLTDFGIAKAMNKREHTGTGVVKGKVAFMSPEQAMGKPIDARSDLFSVGTMLYLLMTGKRPFEAPTDLETLLRVQKADFRPPDTTSPDMEPALAAIISRAMRLQPDERYQSADEMLVDVERVMRTVFQPVGQTELKRWLAELQARDGGSSIGKAASQSVSSAPGSGEMEGKDVVLVDSRSALDVGEEETSLDVLGRAETESRPRSTRHRPAENVVPLPIPDDDKEEPASGRPSRAEFSLPVPEDDGPPGRRRRRSGGRGLLTIVVVGALLVFGAWLAGSYMGFRVQDPATSAGGHETGAQPKSAPAGPTTAPPAPTPAPAAGGTPAATTAPKRPLEPPAPGEARERPASAAKKGRVRHGIDDLKKMMAPDPSLLPPPAPPSSPKEQTEPDPQPAAAPAPASEPEKNP
ncbi:MAG TPA: serine/threonine-protein kinase [Polyangia bacterium]|nr:serine/threonine-protein kinase [Polyangia bacterium]